MSYLRIDGAPNGNHYVSNGVHQGNHATSQEKYLNELVERRKTLGGYGNKKARRATNRQINKMRTQLEVLQTGQQSQAEQQSTHSYSATATPAPTACTSATTQVYVTNIQSQKSTYEHSVQEYLHVPRQPQHSRGHSVQEYHVRRQTKQVAAIQQQTLSPESIAIKKQLLERKVREQRSEIEQLQIKLGNFEWEVNMQKGAINYLEGRVVRRNQTISGMEQRITELQQANEDQNQIIERQIKTIQENAQTIAGMDQTINEQRQIIEEQDRINTEKDQKIGELEENNSRLQRRINFLEAPVYDKKWRKKH